MARRHDLGHWLARMEQDVSLAGNSFIARKGDWLYRLRPDWVDIIRTRKVGWSGVGLHRGRRIPPLS